MRLASCFLVLSACYAPAIPANGACETACPGDQVCVNGVCRSPGELDIDAGPDGSPVVDTDGDGLFDSEDNCIAVANRDQHDEDADAHGDACDRCPHLADAVDADLDGDGVGDACDPQPTVASQSWLYFDPFTSRRPEWTDSSDVTFATDRMILADGYLQLEVPNTEFRFVTGGDITDVATASPHQHAISFGEGVNGRYYYVEFFDDGSGGGLKISQADGNEFSNLDSTPYPGVAPAGAWSWVIDSSVAKQSITVESVLGGTARPRLEGADGTPPLTAGPVFGFGTQNVTATYDYIGVIVTSP